jgi:pimeloyl-ACP methyl ester carboxylesterase
MSHPGPMSSRRVCRITVIAVAYGPSARWGAIVALAAIHSPGWPTLLVHGERDPVFSLGHGQPLHNEIPGAELLILEQAGHELPPPLWDVFVPALVRHTAH